MLDMLILFVSHHSDTSDQQIRLIKSKIYEKYEKRVENIVQTVSANGIISNIFHTCLLNS